MSEELDENDPLYALKKWGPDYRFKDGYWQWRHARTDAEEEKKWQNGPRTDAVAAKIPVRGW